MIKVLCYGDSNTYGFDPVTGLRYPKSIRWTGRLQKILGEKYEIIEEGCNGRTTILEDKREPWKNGMSYIHACLNSHKPVDIVIMMLGSNDLKCEFQASAETIAYGAEKLIETIKEFTTQKQGFFPIIILVAPPVIGEGIEDSSFSSSFDKSAITRSMEFGRLYEEAAKRQNCCFFNAAAYIHSSKEDSLHLEPEAHRILADELGKYIFKILSRKFKEERIG